MNVENLATVMGINLLKPQIDDPVTMMKGENSIKDDVDCVRGEGFISFNCSHNYETLTAQEITLKPNNCIIPRDTTTQLHPSPCLFGYCSLLLKKDKLGIHLSLIE